MSNSLRKLEGLHRWKLFAIWSPVVWLPLSVYWMLTNRSPLAIGFAIAGVAFFGFARGVIYFSRCPECEKAFRDSPVGFRRIWNELCCDACGISLFELRRGRARD